MKSTSFVFHQLFVVHRSSFLCSRKTSKVHSRTHRNEIDKFTCVALCTKLIGKNETTHVLPETKILCGNFGNILQVDKIRCANNKMFKKWKGKEMWRELGNDRVEIWKIKWNPKMKNETESKLWTKFKSNQMFLSYDSTRFDSSGITSVWCEGGDEWKYNCEMV